MQQTNSSSRLHGSQRWSSKLRIKSSMNYLVNTYETRQILGEGGFGKVFKGIKRNNKKSVALKFISKEKITEFCIHEKTSQKIPLEAALLSQCQGIPGVIRLHEIIEIEERNLWCIVMESPVNSMDLFDYITTYGPLQEETAVYILNQLIHTVIGCHKAGVAHKDIKDENIIIDISTKEIKLIDFGAGHYDIESECFEYNGTTIYSPPEWIRDGYYYASELETWSIGALLFSMITGDIPFRNNEEIIDSQISIDSESEECKDLILSCLCKERDKRIRLENILSHSWFQKYHLSMDNV